MFSMPLVLLTRLYSCVFFLGFSGRALCSHRLTSNSVIENSLEISFSCLHIRMIIGTFLHAQLTFVSTCKDIFTHIIVF